MKHVIIAEKPSVANEYAKVLGVTNKGQGYYENDQWLVTWAVGHLVSLAYPEKYDVELKEWKAETLPFIPDTFKYELIPDTRKQFQVIKTLYNREDIDVIYYAGDAGREGLYIQMLIRMLAGHKSGVAEKVVWIDSQTEDEIMRGISEAKSLSEYSHMSDAGYMRAIADYLVGINFSRLLSIFYAAMLNSGSGQKRKIPISVGRVMTCVLGMIVKREREIRQFVPTPFYRVLASTEGFEAEWKTTKDSAYLDSPLLYKENGFKKEESAKQLITELSADAPIELIVQKVEKKTEKKAPPMLYNLAELQNDCSRLFKISPTDTLNTVQTLYERKLVTYPRTDARVLSTAVAKEIGKNIGGLQKYEPLAQYAQYIMQQGGYKGVAKSKYVNDKQITDHYAIIPTGQGLGNLNGLNDIQRKVYDIIARRFLSIFFPAAEYEKVSLVLSRQIHTVVGEKENGTESFFANFKRLKNPGYLTIAGLSSDKKQEEQKLTDEELAKFASLKKGDAIPVQTFNIKEGETSPPKRYSSGTLILAMENAGQLIEDEELRSQIKGSGIGTSATRDSIITKLVTNKYIALNKKTQIVTPTFLGEIIYDVCLNSIQSLLWAEMTASWEKGLSGVAEGTISKDEYTAKMNKFVCDNTNAVKQIRNQNQITRLFDRTKPFYEKAGAKKAAKKS